ncbi:MAG: SDR family oxidoreductase [Bacteroidetes bacterium]|nr:SDR family oxidoreductase [Bacteroidota bacterium]
MKNILIIGASSGIGNALADKLSKEANVFATFNTHPQSAENIHYHFLNVLDEQSDFSFLPDTLDALVYCPGSILLKPFSRLTGDEFLHHYQLNVLGAVRCIQKVLPLLKKSSQASIVLFSTVAVQTGMPFHALVSASKGAVEGLTKALAAEFAPNIRVNCIAPSLTDTPLAASLLSSDEKRLASANRHPLKLVGDAEDVAAMANYLISNDAKFITGQIFHIDGGISSLKV